MSRSSSESSETCHRQEEDGFVNRLWNIPVVKSAVSQASSIYTKAKEANTMTKISLSLAEMSIKAAVESTKFAYNVVPVPGFVGTLKEEAEKKVGEADALACKGLDLLEEKYPAIMSEPQEILSSGANKIEKSDVIEAALIISEAALDYITPAKKKEMNGNVKPRVVSSKKLDRMIDVSRRTGMGIYRGGSKIVWNTATAPWYATKTGLNLASRAAVGAAHLTSDVISIIPGLSGMVKPRRKARRSRRRVQRKPDSRQTPFSVSPEKKRKRSNGENNSDEETLYEMLYVKEYYASDEDPDYCPEDHVNDSHEDSSDTVGASDEEGDSGEGDEVDISEAGGHSLTAEQAKSRSVKFESGHTVHGPQGSLVVHVTDNKRSSEIHMIEKEDQKANQMPGTQQEVTKDGAAAHEKKDGEKSAKSPVLKTVKSPSKTRAKNYAAVVGKENVPKSPSEKTTAGVSSALKAGDKTRSVKSPDVKDAGPRAAKKEGVKNGLPAQAADSNVSQKDDPFRVKGRIIL